MREGAGKPGKPREGSSQAELGNAWAPLPPLDFAFSAALAGQVTWSPHQPVKGSSYFQQLLYHRSPVAFDTAQSMILEDIQLNTAELGNKEREGALSLGAQGLDTVIHVQPHRPIIGTEKGQLTCSFQERNKNESEHEAKGSVKGTNRHFACYECMTLLVSQRMWSHKIPSSMAKQKYIRKGEMRGTLNHEQ